MRKAGKALIICLTIILMMGICPSVSWGATCAQQGFTNGFYDENGYHEEISENNKPDYDRLGHGTVYISISKDGEYVDSPETGEKMTMVPVNMEEVAREIQLSEFGYEEYNHYRHDDGDNNDETRAITSLFHVYLYVMEHYYGGKSANEIEITGGTDSLYMKNGFWGHDENLTYYVNGKYPLYYDGWGATADGIFPEDGDFIDIQMYSDWNFWSDDNAGYHYFTNSDNSRIIHEFNTKAGETLTVGLVRSWGDVDRGENTSMIPEDNYTFYYGKTAFADGEGCKEGTVVNGKASIRFDEPGTYFMWASGGTSDRLNGAAVSAPAYAKVIVGEGNAEESHDIYFVEAQEPSCEESGWREYFRCDTCGKLFADSEENVEISESDISIPAAGHKYRTITTAGGYLYHGVTYRKCEVCGKETDHISADNGYGSPGVKAFKVYRGKKCFTAKWKKASKSAQKSLSGYQIRYSKNANMSNARFASAGKSSRSKKVKGLIKKTRYYVQARTYVKNRNGKFYSGWSSKKTVVVK